MPPSCEELEGRPRLDALDIHGIVGADERGDEPVDSRRCYSVD